MGVGVSRERRLRRAGLRWRSIGRGARVDVVRAVPDGPRERLDYEDEPYIWWEDFEDEAFEETLVPHMASSDTFEAYTERERKGKTPQRLSDMSANQQRQLIESSSIRP